MSRRDRREKRETRDRGPRAGLAVPPKADPSSVVRCEKSIEHGAMHSRQRAENNWELGTKH